MKLSKVEIEFFKDSGKYYSRLEFLTKKEPHDIESIIDEAKELSGFIPDYDFTIEVSNHYFEFNKRLIKKAI